MEKCALITGVGGQDGHYLSQLLLSKNYRVVGMGIQKANLGLEYIECNISEKEKVTAAIRDLHPDEIYNLAGISSIRIAESNPQLATAVNSKGVSNIIEAIRTHAPHCRLFQASSAYIFAPSMEKKTEDSPVGPQTTYGKTKLQAQLAVKKAREDGIFACSGILFNHESALRTEDFVTRKVSKAAAQFALGKRSAPLMLGDMDAVRDWGFAGDYVEAMWMMLQAKAPKDYIIATGIAHSVRELCRKAFECVELDYAKYTAADPQLAARKEGNLHVGDPSLIKKELNWRAKTSFEELVEMMVKEDLKNLG